MTSKEMLDHLRDMKIPAKSASSTLEDAYVSIVRKKLKPILEDRAAQIEAAKKAEEEAAARALGYTHHPPKLWLDPAVTDFYAFTTDHLRLEGYQCHELGEKIPVAI